MIPKPRTPQGSTRTSDDHRIYRRGIAVAAALRLACGVFVTYGVLGSDDDPVDKRPTSPSAEVIHEVLGEGAADISYRGGRRRQGGQRQQRPPAVEEDLERSVRRFPCRQRHPRREGGHGQLHPGRTCQARPARHRHRCLRPDHMQQ
ncbi:hypothetical protein GCM10010518_20980 [Kitasatospora cinereorecta]